VLLPLLVAIHEISVDEGAPLVLIRLSPKGLSRPIDSDRFHRAADDVIRSGSRLRLLSAEQAGVDLGVLADCELDRRLTCWCEEILRAASALPEGDRPAYALIISMVDGDRTLEATSLSIDLARARSVLESSASESRLFDIAVTSRPAPIDDLDAYFADLFRGLAPELGPLASPPGSIRLETDPGAAIFLDGAAVGSSPSSSTSLSGLAPGRRRLAVRLPSGVELAADVDVTPGAETGVDLTPHRDPPATLAETVGLYGGIAIAAAGVVLTSVAIGLASGPDDVTPCAGPSCAANEGRDFYRSNGVLLAPLGYGLILTGGCWSLGSALLEDDLYVWLSLAAGVALGGATYAISAVAD
jgi:hypothetical protein